MANPTEGRAQPPDFASRTLPARGILIAAPMFEMLFASILIADDDAHSARQLERLLTDDGHRVSVVSTGDAALEACDVDPPELVLIDLVAPQGHGFTVCRCLKEQPT